MVFKAYVFKVIETFQRISIKWG